MNRSTKTRLLLRDKYKVVHSDRLYRPPYRLLFNGHLVSRSVTCYISHTICKVISFITSQYTNPIPMERYIVNFVYYIYDN